MNQKQPEIDQNPIEHQKTQPESTQSASPAPSSRSLTPFHHNYTLTGLINHIENTVTEMISNKKKKENELPNEEKSQLRRLIKIQEEVEVLKNIIVYNLSEIFNVMYPSTCQSRKEPKTDITITKITENEKDESLTLSDFDGENEGQKMGKINHLQVNRQSFHFYNSQWEREDCSQGANEGHRSEDLAKRSQILRENQEITPFQLPQKLYQLSKQSETIKVEDEDRDEEGIDLLCYQDSKSIEGYHGIKWREESEKGFSPIEEREPWEEETEQKKLNTFTLNQFHSHSTGEDISRMSPRDITKKLFSYSGIGMVLPRRLRKKKYNYLEEVTSKR